MADTDCSDPIELVEAEKSVRIHDLDAHVEEENIDLILAAAWPPSPHGGW